MKIECYQDEDGNQIRVFCNEAGEIYIGITPDDIDNEMYVALSCEDAVGFRKLLTKAIRESENG